MIALKGHVGSLRNCSERRKKKIFQAFKVMNNKDRARENWRKRRWGKHYDPVVNCAVNKLVGLSCFLRLQPAGAFVCLFVCLFAPLLCRTFSCIRTNDNAAGNTEPVDGSE